MNSVRLVLAISFALCVSMKSAEPCTTIDIVSLSKKPIVKAMLNGKEAYFLLDTGSDLSILNTQLSEDYRFATTELPDIWQVYSIGLQGNTGKMMGIGAAKVYLGDTRIRTRWLGADMQALTNSIRKKTRIKIVGIIGSDVMKKYEFVIDYAGQKIQLRDPKRAPKTESPELSSKGNMLPRNVGLGAGQ